MAFNPIGTIAKTKRKVDNLKSQILSIKFIVNIIIEKRNPIIKRISKHFACVSGQHP